MTKTLKILFSLLVFILLIILAVIVFLMLYKPKVYASKDQCEADTKSTCTYYLCDIPLGQLYQKLCVNGPGSGWYDLRTKAD
jgi:hypothetical protein